MKVAIVANGSMEYSEKIKAQISDCDLCICCDGGAAHFAAMNLLPDYLIGDFDSIQESLLEQFKSKGVEIIEFPKEKDATDTHIAIEFAIEKGANHIEMFGTCGSRLDHTLSNLFLLEFMNQKGCAGKVITQSNEVMLLEASCGAMEIKASADKQEKEFISIISLAEQSEGVTLKGFKYPLQEATLRRHDSVGISNELTLETGIIALRRGKLLIFRSKD